MSLALFDIDAPIRGTHRVDGGPVLVLGAYRDAKQSLVLIMDIEGRLTFTDMGEVRADWHYDVRRDSFVSNDAPDEPEDATGG